MGYYLICIALAFISYLWVPLLLILFKIPLSRKRRLIAIIANCLIVVLLFNLHHLVTDFQPVNYTATLLYGCIGYLMLNKWGTPEDEARNIKKILYCFSLITGFYFVFSAIFIAYCGFTGYYDLGYSAASDELQPQIEDLEDQLRKANNELVSYQTKVSEYESKVICEKSTHYYHRENCNDSPVWLLSQDAAEMAGFEVCPEALEIGRYYYQQYLNQGQGN
mgnify:CR=1 FL=1